MNYKDLWLTHSHRINADDSEKYMDEEDFKIAILEWESAKTVSRVELPVMQRKCDIEQKYKDLRDYILEKEKEGKIVVNTAFGLGEISLDEIVKQHTEGLLYDLNRDRGTILTFIEDEKWVNDFACMKVIEKLKALLSA